MTGTPSHDEIRGRSLTAPDWPLQYASHQEYEAALLARAEAAEHALSSLIDDLTDPTRNDSSAKRVAVRSDHDVLVSLAQLLEESVAVQRHILAALGSSSDSRSSVELKVSSARTVPDPTVKVYEGSPVDGLADTALAEFGRLKREAEAHALDGWRQTLSDLAERKAG